MKHLLRIPTPRTPDPEDKYGYIETEFEGTPEEAWAEYLRITHLMLDTIKPKPVNEMPDKEFDELIDEYETTNKIADGADRYASLGDSKRFSQKDIVQILKRSKKRTQ